MARKVTDDEKTLIEGMLRTISQRRSRNQLRRNFSDAEYRAKVSGYDIPPAFDNFRTALNWPQKAVTAFAARQVPTGFSARVQTSLVDDLQALSEENGFDALERQVIESADELGVAFVFSTLGGPGEPTIINSARTALTATAVLDRRTGSVSAALETIDHTHANLYVPGSVLECKRSSDGWQVVNETATGTRRVLCAPYAHGATLAHPFGRSRITQPIMDLTLAGCRTLLRQEVAATHYMAPRLAGMGLNADDLEGSFSAFIGEIYGIPDISKEDDPNLPDVLRRADLKVLPQMSQQPFSDQYRLLAGAMSGASSLPPQYLGVMQDSNPTSAQAIEATEIDFIREVRAQNPILGRGRKMLAINNLSLLYGDTVLDGSSELQSLHADWEDPRTRSMSEQSQMASLQVAAGNLQPGTRTTLRQLPLSAEDVEAAVRENERAAGSSILDRALDAAGSDAQEATVDETKLQDRANTFGILIRSGATPESAAKVASGELDISQVEMRPGVLPVTIRTEGE